MEFDSSFSYNPNMTVFVVEHFEISNPVYALFMYVVILFHVMPQKIPVGMYLL